ncbi:Transcription factor MYC/MYB N-terminal protein [Dioscorea alata]|uniref:Transcription factor MYC/MYB N-terminal protein n=2 Tax=Dioscorea alata TaxID=55571 RepID=A0ACB7VXY2_DIOAL|nr:Transcription factor MYC/MYB N-terminal protein [Dioscorea alata]KAH7679556.1 Transcription factor MYC/MYB N-terminal protein [Dioscorea alata]
MQLQHLLQLSVQSINWTYSIFWQLNPQNQVLEWRDGYYNGVIKNRKTVLGPFEVSLEDDAAQRSRQLRELYDALVSEQLVGSSPAPVGLSPEDLTEVEWFYLVSVSFSFSSGEGLPGKAFERQRHVWLRGANEVNRKDLCRAILFKSAGIQTIVCIPILDGVLEFGTTEKVEEDLSVIQQARSLFKEYENDNPTLSEQSTSSPVNNSMLGFRHLVNAAPMNVDAQQGGTDEEEEEDDDEEDEGDIGDLEMSEDVGSDNSNSVSECAQPSDDECSETISSLPQNNLIETAKSMSLGSLVHSKNSAFTEWGSHNGNHFLSFFSRRTSQRMLKFMLFKVPDLHCASVQEELSTNHVLAERRRREKINKRFIVLRSIVPFVTKMDKTSILESTIEYLKRLQRQIEELKSRKEKMGINLRTMNTETSKVETPCSTNVKVSIIEANALFKLQCPYKDGLLFKIMQKLHELGLETTSIQSSTINKIFVAELRAKVKEINGRKATIMEVKRAIYQIFS